MSWRYGFRLAANYFILPESVISSKSAAYDYWKILISVYELAYYGGADIRIRKYSVS